MVLCKGTDPMQQGMPLANTVLQPKLQSEQVQFAYLSLASQDSVAYSAQQALVMLLHWKLLFLVAQLFELS